MRLSSVISTYPDDEFVNLQIEIVLPGVEKKEISFKIAEDGLYVRATKEGVVYADDCTVYCPISSEKAVAGHSNGVLKLQYLISNLLKTQ